MRRVTLTIAEEDNLLLEGYSKVQKILEAEGIGQGIALLNPNSIRPSKSCGTHQWYLAKGELLR